MHAANTSPLYMIGEKPTRSELDYTTVRPPLEWYYVQHEMCFDECYYLLKPLQAIVRSYQTFSENPTPQ